MNDSAPARDSVARPTVRTDRFWLAALVLVAYWGMTESLAHLELSDIQRFGSRMLALIVLLVFFTVWWLRRPEIARRDRWLLVPAVSGVFIAACLVADASLNPLGMFMAGWPWLCTLGLVWLWLSRGSTSRRRTLGVAAVACLVFGVLSLLRWDGLSGRQLSSYSWRWSPTAEQRFLAAQGAKPQADGDAALQREVVLRPGDWPGFRGADRNGIVRGVSASAWVDPPRLLWKHKVGPAWSSVAVVDGLLFTQEQRGPEECTVCYDAATGEQRWVHRHTARFDEPLSGPGPRGTPTFADGRLYSYGARGDLACLAADTGQVVWQAAVLTDNAGAVPMWGLSVSPLVTDGLVVVFVGGPNGRGLLAFDAATGQERWAAAAGQHSYASPHVVTLAGTRQIVMHDDIALRGLAIDNGRTLWEHANPGQSYQPMLQPHVVGDQELVVAWDNGLARLKFTPADPVWQVETLWTSTQLRPSFNDFYIHDGHIFGLSDGILSCLSLDDAKRKWKGGRYGSGQLLLLPEAHQLLVVTEQGELVVVAADAARHRELARHPAIAGKTWNHAAFAQGRLYVRNAEELAGLECGAAATANEGFGEPSPSGPAPVDGGRP